MPEKVFHLQPWAPETKIIANQIIQNVKQITPELEILFMGAAALELPGKNDIDLDIFCDVKDIKKYTNKLQPVLGEPKEATDNISAWNYHIDGFEIDLILSDPKISHVKNQRNVFEILKTNTKLLDDYKQLKIECDAIPYPQYKKRKIDFFENIVLSKSNSA